MDFFPGGEVFDQRVENIFDFDVPVDPVADAHVVVHHVDRFFRIDACCEGSAVDICEHCVEDEETVARFDVVADFWVGEPACVHADVVRKRFVESAFVHHHRRKRQAQGFNHFGGFFVESVSIEEDAGKHAGRFCGCKGFKDVFDRRVERFGVAGVGRK